MEQRGETMTLPQLPLNNGLTIPAIGLGTWKMAKDEAACSVFTAITVGYRHIDCAAIYNNEREVGEALHKALTQKIVRRDELWITSKLWNNAHLPQHVQPAAERSIRELGLDYLDLFLIHWPVSFRQDIVFPKKPEQYLPPDDSRLLATWQAMEKLVKKGLVRAIGVSNFKKSRLQMLADNATIPPAVNQVECHPCLPQRQLLEYCKKEGIVLTAYAPLGSGDRPQKTRTEGEEAEILELPIVTELAAEAGISRAQLLLAWGLARETCIIPKSTQKSRIKENLAATEISIAPEIIQRLNSVDKRRRLISGAFFCGEKSPYTLDWIWRDPQEQRSATEKSG